MLPCNAGGLAERSARCGLRRRWCHHALANMSLFRLTHRLRRGRSLRSSSDTSKAKASVPSKSAREGVIGRLPSSAMPSVALTFDDGPQAHSTEVILDTLVDAGVTATFFVVGQECERYPNLLRRVVEAGMSIGVHGWSHADLVGRDVAFVTDELRRTIDVIGSAGVCTTLFRPPYGHWDR